MGTDIGTVDDRTHEANFSSHRRGRSDLRESFGFADSITPECSRHSRAVPKEGPPPTVAARILGKYALKINVTIFGRFAHDLGANGYCDERRILFTGNGDSGHCVHHMSTGSEQNYTP